jgi:hypothetical protein
MSTVYAFLSKGSWLSLRFISRVWMIGVKLIDEVLCYEMAYCTIWDLRTSFCSLIFYSIFLLEGLSKKYLRLASLSGLYCGSLELDVDKSNWGGSGKSKLRVDDLSLGRSPLSR